VDCELVLGTSVAACDARRVLPREAALCAAVNAGADATREPWRVSLVFIERFGQLAWGVQVPINADSRRNYKLDAFSGDVLDITHSTSVD
jgi:hypothetical protein